MYSIIRYLTLKILIRDNVLILHKITKDQVFFIIIFYLQIKKRLDKL